VCLQHENWAGGDFQKFSEALSISSSREDIMFACVASYVGMASAVHLAFQHGWRISSEIIHLFDTEIKQLADRVDSKLELLALLPSLATHASFTEVVNKGKRCNNC
jgi:hypothetical protein